ncbi:MAG UNVERIFIED_CONTAM: hypothetical protein LVR18_19515 [Planctomycetaceae bacterium]
MFGFRCAGMGNAPDYFANHSPPRKAGLHHGKGKEGKRPGGPASKKSSPNTPQSCKEATAQSEEKSGTRQGGPEAAAKTCPCSRPPPPRSETRGNGSEDNTAPRDSGNRTVARTRPSHRPYTRTTGQRPARIEACDPS